MQYRARLKLIKAKLKYKHLSNLFELDKVNKLLKLSLKNIFNLRDVKALHVVIDLDHHSLFFFDNFSMQLSYTIGNNEVVKSSKLFSFILLNNSSTCLAR